VVLDNLAARPGVGAVEGEPPALTSATAPARVSRLPASREFPSKGE
jgi:hypothetical protein